MSEANLMFRPNNAPSRRLLLALLVALPVSGWALPGDNEQPINIEADRAKQVGHNGGEKTEYFGNVVMSQGSMLLTGNHVTIFSKDSAVEKVISVGEPAHFQQQSDPEKDPVKAYGKRLVYILNKETLTIINDASIIQDGTTVSGQKIVYNVATEQVQANSNNEQRVQMILQPAKKPKAPATIDSMTNKDSNGNPDRQ
jgi:lipopolysaccharide export system protein LptA